MNDERADEADLTERTRTATVAAGAVLDDAGETSGPDPATAARVDAWLLGAASSGRRSSTSARSTSARSTGDRSTGRRSTGTHTADHRSRGRVLAAVGAIAVVAGVLVLVTTRGDKTAAPAAVTKPSSATTNAVRTASTVTTTATAATATTVSTPPATRATTVATPVATTVATPATTVATPATTVVTTTSPATTGATPAALSEAAEFLGLVEARYPSGQSWPRGVLTDGKVVITGAVPDQATRDRIVRTFAFAPEGAPIVDSMVIDNTVPVPSNVLWTVVDATIFVADSAQLVVPDESLDPTGHKIVSLWARRLTQVPDARAIVVVRRDSAGDAVAQKRAEAIKTLFQDSDAGLRQVTVGITGTPTDAGTQVAFALRLAS